MDVEGAEMLALSGMKQLIENNDSLSMLVEFFPLLISNMGQSPEEFIRRILDDFGFEVFVVKDDYSMRGKSLSNANLRITTAKQMMSLCTDQNDHFNLYLRGGTYPA
jgi:hypothetical protein